MTVLNENLDFNNSRLRDNFSNVYLPIYESLWDDEVLRPKQKEAIRALANALMTTNSRALALIMPPAAGKTVIAARLAKAFLDDKVSGQPDKRVLFITDSKEAIAQTKQKFMKFSEIQVGGFYGDEKTVEGNVIVTTLHSAQSPDFPFEKDKFDLVFVDDGHKAISVKRIDMQKQFINAVLVGLSGTPTYSKDHSLLQYYDLAYELSVSESVHSNLISSFRNILLRTDEQIDLNSIGMSRTGDYNEKALARALNTEARNRMLNEEILFGYHPDTGKPLREMTGLISCANIDHSKDEVDQLNKLFNKYFGSTFNGEAFVAHVDGKTKNREKLVQWHKDGVIQYLSYSNLFLNNYDNPRVELAANLRLTQSDVVAAQRAGRAMRNYEGQPEKIALILDVLDSYSGDSKRFPRLYGHTVGKAHIITPQVESLAKKKRYHYDSNKISGRRLIQWDSETKEMIKNAEMRLVTDQEEILSIIKGSDDSKLQEKTRKDLTRREVARALAISVEEVSIAFNLTVSQAKEHSKNKDVPEPKFNIYPVESRGRHVFALNSSDLVDFGKEYFPEKMDLLKKHLPKKGPEDLSATEISKIYVGDQNLVAKKVKKTFQEIQNEWEKFNQEMTAVIKPDFSVKKVAAGKANQPLTLHKNDLVRFTEKFFPEQLSYILDESINVKSDNDLNLESLSKLIHKPFIAIKPIYDKLKEDWKKYIVNPDKVDKPKILFKNALSSENHKIIVMPEDQVEAFVNEFFPQNAIYLKREKNIRKKTKDDFIPVEMSKIIGKKPNVIYKAFSALENSWNQYYNDKDNKELPYVNLNKVISGKRLVYTIHADQLKEFVNEFFPEKLSHPKLISFLAEHEKFNENKNDTTTHSTEDKNLKNNLIHKNNM